MGGQEQQGRVVRVVSARAAIAGVVVAALLSGAVVAVSAGPGGPFPDVGPGHPFVNEIRNLSNAGITGGFNDGGYHPGDPVTRQSMAAFLGRGLGRVGYTSFDYGVSTEITADNGTISLPTVSLRPGAAINGTNGFALVTATISLNANAAGCPCTASVGIRASKNDFVNVDFISAPRLVDLSTSEKNATVSVQAVIPVQANQTYKFQVRAANDVTSFNAANTNTRFSGTVTAVYVPYGASGGNTIS